MVCVCNLHAQNLEKKSHNNICNDESTFSDVSICRVPDEFIPVGKDSLTISYEYRQIDFYNNIDSSPFPWVEMAIQRHVNVYVVSVSMR